MYIIIHLYKKKKNFFLFCKLRCVKFHFIFFFLLFFYFLFSNSISCFFLFISLSWEYWKEAGRENVEMIKYLFCDLLLPKKGQRDIRFIKIIDFHRKVHFTKLISLRHSRFRWLLLFFFIGKKSRKDLKFFFSKRWCVLW